MPGRILLIEDDADIRELVSHHLTRASYQVKAAGDAREGWELVSRWGPELVVLDLMLPDGHGFDLCRRLRERGEAVGIVILTALSDEADQVAGLELGADDYVVKPFRPRELVARVRAVLRRVTRPPSAGVVRVGRLSLDPVRMLAQVDGDVVPLTAMEFGLLHVLAERPGAVLSRAQILDRVWGSDFVGEERTVDVHVRHIRSKLAAAGIEGLIETVRGVGYRLRSEEP
ncbi:MAG: response regulator transcription factor [Clostridia bacterium]|nr:response regulator transcription factor [Clostridia bacterium]